MGPVTSPVRAPAGHRAAAALACPVLGVLIARLVVQFVVVPTAPLYAVCAALGAAVGWRAWTARVDLVGDALTVRNTIASTRVPVAQVRRVNELGRVEWRPAGSRTTRLPSEALHGPWWTFGRGADAYAENRFRVREWLDEARDGAPPPPDTGVIELEALRATIAEAPAQATPAESAAAEPAADPAVDPAVDPADEERADPDARPHQDG